MAFTALYFLILVPSVVYVAWNLSDIVFGWINQRLFDRSESKAWSRLFVAGYSLTAVGYIFLTARSEQGKEGWELIILLVNRLAPFFIFHGTLILIAFFVRMRIAVRQKKTND